MPPLSYPLRFVLVALAGWMNQRQRDVIEYLQEEMVRASPPESTWADGDHVLANHRLKKLTPRIAAPYCGA